MVDKKWLKTQARKVRQVDWIDPALYRRVKELLDRNKAERHLRGGAATRRKYKGEPELPD